MAKLNVALIMTKVYFLVPMEEYVDMQRVHFLVYCSALVYYTLCLVIVTLLKGRQINIETWMTSCLILLQLM